MIHKKERNVDYRKQLRRLKKYELQTLAGKLNLENFSGLKKDKLIDFIIENCTGEQIQATLGIPSEKSWKKKQILFFTEYLTGAPMQLFL